VVELAKLSATIPDEVALETTIHGRPEDCVEQIQRFVRAGCKHIILFFILMGQSWTGVVKHFAEEVLPHFL